MTDEGQRVWSTEDWQELGRAYAQRIHILERIAIADEKTRKEAQERVAALEVENENLRFRLQMAESNNPDSVLSKHNAMLMAVKRAEEAEAKLELVAAAYKYAHGRWSEWGSRAEGVGEMLEEVLRT